MDFFGTEVVQKEEVSFEFEVGVFSVFLPILTAHVHILFAFLASLLLFKFLLLFLFDIFSYCLVYEGCCLVAFTCLYFIKRVWRGVNMFLWQISMLHLLTVFVYGLPRFK